MEGDFERDRDRDLDRDCERDLDRDLDLDLDLEGEPLPLRFAGDREPDRDRADLALPAETGRTSYINEEVGADGNPAASEQTRWRKTPGNDVR